MQTIVNYIANALQARIPRIKIDTANDAATAHLTIPNKHGGKPINILAKAPAGIVVVFNKTPRLFDQDAKGIDNRITIRAQRTRWGLPKKIRLHKTSFGDSCASR